MAVREVVRGAGFAWLTFGAGAIIFVEVARADGHSAKRAARDRWSGAWARGLLRLFGVEVVVAREDERALAECRGRGQVVVANHRSIIDIAVLLSIFGGALVARGEIEKWPIIGPAARSAGTIFVDRSSKRSGAQAIQAMVDRLAENDTVCLFPEGTTFVDDPVRPFKPGACVAAARAGVPVVPVAIVYPKDSRTAYGGESFLRHLRNLAATTRTRVLVLVGTPLRQSDGESIETFNERSRGEVDRLLRQGRTKNAQDASGGVIRPT